MPLLTLEGPENGIARLMQAMRDLPDYPERDVPDLPLAEAPDPQRRLFGAYRKLLRQAYVEAVPWWEGTVAARARDGRTEEEALAAAFNDRMAGPASYPRVVWIVRAIWLEAAILNRRAPAARVRPETVLLGWLVEAGETELVRLLACMPYWPVGLDAEGNWC